MPILILSSFGSGPDAPGRRTFSSLLAVATVGRAFSGVVATATTGKERTFSGPYIRAATADANSVVLPPLVGAATGYVVTHHGLPLEAVSYSVSMREGEAAPRLEATLRGQVRLSGNVQITVALRREGETYQQTYGPFGALGYTFTQTPSGWVTALASADMSAADADADSPLMPTFETELLPWERERDLTPLQQAQQAREQALGQREVRRRQTGQERAIEAQIAQPGTSPETRVALRQQLRALRRQAAPAPDRRRVPVQDVIAYALASLPMPFKLGAPLPYAGDSFWASEDTGIAFLGGTLIGVSFQIKGKTPVSVLTELLSPIGWQIVIRFGVAYIGPPEALADADQTPGLLELPARLLTGLSIEQVNPEAALGNGNRQLPRRITVEAASARLYLLPLPPELDGDGNLTDPSEFGQIRDGTFVTQSYTYGPSPDTRQERLESHTVATMTKADGRLVGETSRTDGMAPYPGNGFKLSREGFEYHLETEHWIMRENRVTRHRYEDGRYPDAETHLESSTSTYVDFLGKDQETERLLTLQEWHPEGWLRRKTTAKTVFDEFTLALGNGGPGGSVQVKPTVKANREEEVEEWTPINAQTWLHATTRYRGRWIMVTDGTGSAESLVRGPMTEHVSEITDQGPPRAPDSELPEPDEPGAAEDGFPYDERLSAVLEPGGRGDAMTRNVPWATSISPVWLTDVAGSIRRARPSQRTRYEVAAPPRVELGTRIKDFSLSGAGATIRASITVEEESHV